MKKIIFKTILMLFGFVCTANAQVSITEEIDYVLLDTLISRAKQNYPRVKVLSNQSAIAKANVSRAQVSWLDVANFTYLYRPFDNSTINLQNPNLLNGYQVGINLNLGSLIQKPFETKAARTAYNISKLEEDQYTLTLVNEVKKRYFSYVQFLTLVKVRTKSYQDAYSLAQEVKYKYEKGEASYETYSSSSVTLANELQFRIDAEGALFISKAALEELIGQPLEEIKK
ncbi:TolC family protein [Pedobacter glucosidilyticus]|uniref:TolC family protein n=1 Tax=Pedobacter glucosidilyticus TaxID=1122941 RepID=UPI00047BE796|nr:TolC family protein [Pedobacter glucosidilyticus]